MNDIMKRDFVKIEEAFESELITLKEANILITGATGMLASYFGQFLAYYAEKYRFQLFLHCRNIKKAEKIYKNFLNMGCVELVQFSLENTLESNVKYDYIIHAASPASTYFFENRPVEVLEPNSIGTWNLLNYCKENRSKFIMCSSNAIYGEGITKTLLKEIDYGSVDLFNARASYIISKQFAEQMCMAYAKEYEVKTNTIRICHTYGPTFDIEDDKRILPRIIKKILMGEQIEIFDDPLSVIQYTYSADIVSAILCVMVNGKKGEIYNVGSDEMVSLETAIQFMVGTYGNKRIQVKKVKPDESYSFQKGKGVNLSKLDNSKIKGLGWNVLFTSKEGFSRMMESYM